MKKFYKYNISREDIKYTEVNETEFQFIPYGFIIDYEDLTDYSRTVSFELCYKREIILEYYQFGNKSNILINGVEFKGKILLHESLQKHLTFGGYIQTRGVDYEIKWYDPFNKQDYSIRLYSEMPYNYGILGLHSMYFLYLTQRDEINCIKRCLYLWKIINSKYNLFDTGGSQISYHNFKFGDFAEGINELYNDYLSESDTYPFTKKFFNDNIKEALEIWKNEYRRLFLNSNDFQIG